MLLSAGEGLCALSLFVIALLHVEEGSARRSEIVGDAIGRIRQQDAGVGHGSQDQGLAGRAGETTRAQRPRRRHRGHHAPVDRREGCGCGHLAGNGLFVGSLGMVATTVDTGPRGAGVCAKRVVDLLLPHTGLIDRHYQGAVVVDSGTCAFEEMGPGSCRSRD